MDTQKRLFNYISSVLPKGDRLVDHICDVLHISTDQGYARIAGRTYLDLGAAARLMEHFQVPVDRIFRQSGSEVSFRYSGLDMDDMDVYRTYINKLIDMLTAFADKKDCNMIFLADDIPIFHFMPYPELVYFKLYSWTVDTKGIKIAYEKFVQQVQQLKLGEIFEALYKAYLQIPSEEVWCASTIDGILSELVQYKKFRSFADSKSVDTLLDQVDMIWQCHKDWGGKRNKPSGRSFDFFYSGIPFSGSKMLLTSETDQRAILKLYTINSISTDNPKFVNEVHTHMKAVIDRGALIGTSSRDARIQFEHLVQKKIKDVRKQIKHII